MRTPISSSDSADWRLDIRLFGVPLTEPELCLDGCVGNDDRRISGGGLAPTVRIRSIYVTRYLDTWLGDLIIRLPNRRKVDRFISKDLWLWIGYLGRNRLCIGSSTMDVFLELILPALDESLCVFQTYIHTCSYTRICIVSSFLLIYSLLGFVT